MIIGCYRDSKGYSMYKLDTASNVNQLDCPPDNRLEDSVLVVQYGLSKGNYQPNKELIDLLIKHDGYKPDDFRGYEVLWKGKVTFKKTQTGAVCTCDYLHDKNSYILDIAPFELIKMSDFYLILNGGSSRYGVSRTSYVHYFPEKDSIHVICFDCEDCLDCIVEGTFDGEAIGHIKKEDAEYIYYYSFCHFFSMSTYEGIFMILYKINKKSGAITHKFITDINGIYFAKESDTKCDSSFQNKIQFDWDKWQMKVSYVNGKDTIIDIH